MEIRRLEIRNFRGIKELTWKIPAGRGFLALIGPGDSSKSTILTAIDLALSERWNLSFADTDFFDSDISQPISIQVTLTDLPAEVRDHRVLGMHMCGLDSEGELHQDPDDDHEACVVIALTVDRELEPRWTAHRPGRDTEEAPVTSAARRLIGAYKVDERIDSHLRWTKTSALGRLTEMKDGASQLLVEANRAARAAVSTAIPEPLQALTRSVQAKMHDLGSGDFSSLQPGLDQSLSSSSGNLALYEGNVPLTNYGLGSRRLAGVAAQQLAYEGRTFLLVDEIEYGLEPHRLVNLVKQLRRTDIPGQVLVTTHSPTALQHLGAGDLAVVRATPEGTVTVTCLNSDDEEVQKVLRASPEAFLARRVAIGEGKTEYGLLLGLLERWDDTLAKTGDPVSAAAGVVAVEGSGSGTVTTGETLDRLGYEVTLLLDSDVPADVVKADAFHQRPLATVVRWQDGFNAERAVCEVQDADGLTAVIHLAVGLSENPEDASIYFLSHLKAAGLPGDIDSLDVAQWTASGVAVEQARELIASVASKKKWFKQVHRGIALTDSLLRGAHLPDSDEHQKLVDLRAAIFIPRDTAAQEGPGNGEETAK